MVWMERCCRIRCRISGGRERRGLFRQLGRGGSESRARRPLSSGRLRARVLVLIVEASML